MQENLICIRCPVGCELDVLVENGCVAEVVGNQCPMGKDYAEQEIVSPVRMFTAIMKCRGKDKPFPVKSARPIPKDMVLNCAMELKKHHPLPPVKRGEIVVQDICGTGCDIIAVEDA